LNEAFGVAESELARALGHSFRDAELLRQALTHSGAGHGRKGFSDNERLEFLGDRVLGLIIAEMLVDRFAEAREGELGPRLTAMVRREALAEVATAIRLGEHLVLAPADAAAGARTNPKLLADACEAVIAALFLDGGIDAARRFILRHWQPLIGRTALPPVEPKTALQEWAQSKGKKLPAYHVVRTTGTPHAPVFDVSVEVEGCGTEIASGASKRAAEKEAAASLLRRLGLAGL
jgi:ribonuclease-3